MNGLSSHGRVQHEGHSCEIILNFGSLVQMSFKDISYVEFWRPFCSAQWNHLPDFGRRGTFLCNYSGSGRDAVI